MNQQRNHHAEAYGPMQYKTFAGALCAFFQAECPQLGGQRTRQVLVQSITEMVGRFYPETSHLRPGQIQWTTVHRDAKPSYGKTIQNTQLASVILDLVRPEDAKERSEGKCLRDLKKEAVARLLQQAFEQEGCLTNVETAILLKISPATVGKYIREWEKENRLILPRRGTIHDMGPTLTHKPIILRKLVLEGKSVEQVSRETCHTPEAIHIYLKTFRQVFLCRRKGLCPEEIAFATKRSLRLILEYLKLLDEFSEENKALHALLQLDEQENLR